MVPRAFCAAIFALFAAAGPVCAGDVAAGASSGPRTLADADASDPDGIAAWERHRDAVKIAATLFPDAAFVRLYRCDCAFDAERMIADNEGWDGSVPLRESEVSSLRRAVFYAPEPHIVDACYKPFQYGFLFFDADRRLIGMVAASFSMEYVQIFPASPPSTDMATIMVDRLRLHAIVDAHKARLPRKLGC